MICRCFLLSVGRIELLRLSADITVKITKTESIKLIWIALKYFIPTETLFKASAVEYFKNVIT